MKSILIVTVFALTFVSCRKAGPTEQSEAISGIQFAEALKAWSSQQPEPFVIAFRGDTTYGSMSYEGNLVSNITTDYVLISWQFHDSLFVDTSSAIQFAKRYDENTFRQLFAEIPNQQTEEQMSAFLQSLGLKLRMMYYDASIQVLADSLSRWANARTPPQAIRLGFYMILYEFANSGGYSPVWPRYEALQNLQYLARDLGPGTIESMTTSMNRSLTIDQVRAILEPIGPVQFHDTYFGID